ARNRAARRGRPTRSRRDSLVGPLDAGERSTRGVVREWIGAVVGERRVIGPGQLVLGLGFEHLDQRGRVELAARHLAPLGQTLGAAEYVVRDRDRGLHDPSITRLYPGTWTAAEASGRLGDQLAHSPSPSTTSNARVSPRSMKSSSIASASDSSPRSAIRPRSCSIGTVAQNVWLVAPRAM